MTDTTVMDEKDLSFADVSIMTATAAPSAAIIAQPHVDTKKLDAVTHWLIEQYGTNNVPSFEVNPTTVDALYDLMVKVQARTTASQLILEDKQRKTAEYKSEAKRVGGLLTALHLAPNAAAPAVAAASAGAPSSATGGGAAAGSQWGFPHSVHQSATTLASLACVLELNKATVGSYMAALTELHERSVTLHEQLRTTQHTSQQRLNSSIQSLAQRAQLEKAVVRLEEETALRLESVEEKESNRAYMKSKRAQYKSMMEEIQTSLQKTGISTQLTHGALQTRSQEVTALETALQPLNQRLDAYQQLPPDISLAKLKIEEARDRLRRLETQVASEIEQMNWCG